MLRCKITLLRVIPTMAFTSSHLTIYLAYLSGIPSGMSSDILSGISSDILPGIHIFWHSTWHFIWHFIWHIFSHSIWHIFWHSIWHIFWHPIWNIFWHSIWHIIWHSIWHIFWHSIWNIFCYSIWHIFCYPIWHIYLAYLLVFSPAVEVRQETLWRGFSRLRSGREHWAWMVAVEVRQGTLGVDGRGWGPAGNMAWILAVEVRQGTLGVDSCGWGPAGNTWRGWSWLRSGGGGRRRRRKSTDIKSNNPHLAGGEKTWHRHLSKSNTRLKRLLCRQTPLHPHLDLRQHVTWA